jgi:hypothetical protein
MVRVRDAKGRYVKQQIPKDLFGPRKVPHINSADRYSGSSLRVTKISSCWQPKTPQIATAEKMEKQQEEENSKPSDLATNQEVSQEVVHQPQNQEANTGLQPVEAGIVVDNFRSDTYKDPSDFGWDTTPVALAIKFFGGMADEE